MTLTVAAPPPWAQRFRSDDVDEVREFVTRGWGHHSRVMCGKGCNVTFIAEPAIVERVQVDGGYRTVDKLQAGLVSDLMGGSNLAALDGQVRRDRKAYSALDLARDLDQEEAKKLIAAGAPLGSALALSESGDDTLFVARLRDDLPGLKKRLDAAARTARDETTRLHLHEMSVQVARLTKMGAP